MIDQDKLNNINVDAVEVLDTPEQLRRELPLTPSAFQTVLSGRSQIQAVLDGKDPRLVVVVGP